MKKVSEIINMEIPVNGKKCCVKGKFYYRLSRVDDRNFVNCYLAESNDDNSPKIFLSDDIGEAVIDADETFGMMVGGEFAYYGIEAEVDGLLKIIAEGAAFENVMNMKLRKDNEFQDFKFGGH
jgi:hypothetical protein